MNWRKVAYTVPGSCTDSAVQWRAGWPAHGFQDLPHLNQKGAAIFKSWDCGTVKSASLHPRCSPRLRCIEDSVLSAPIGYFLLKGKVGAQGDISVYFKASQGILELVCLCKKCFLLVEGIEDEPSTDRSSFLYCKGICDESQWSS